MDSLSLEQQTELNQSDLVADVSGIWAVSGTVRSRQLVAYRWCVCM
jgi:hypothetical protein